MQKKKKGFTLVELLVVIAILAILASVSVVGYLSFTNKAKESNDTSLTTQMNTILQGEGATEGANKTAHDAVLDLKDNGLDVTKLTPTSEGYEFVYDLSQDKFFLLDGEKIVAPSNATVSANKTDIYKFVGKDGELSNTYSNYLKDDYVSPATLEISTGFDSGTHKLEVVNLKSDSLTYANVRVDAKELVVEAPKATVDFYGKINKATVKSVDEKHSLHVYGEILSLDVTVGHIVVENGGNINTVTDTSATGDGSKATVEIKNNGIVGAVVSHNQNIVQGSKKPETSEVVNPTEVSKDFAGGIGTEASPYLISNVKELRNISTLSDKMKLNEYNFCLISDISLDSNTSPLSKYFNGVLDGNNYKIITKNQFYLFNYIVNKGILKNVELVNSNPNLVTKFFSQTAINIIKEINGAGVIKDETSMVIEFNNVDYSATSDKFYQIGGQNSAIYFSGSQQYVYDVNNMQKSYDLENLVKESSPVHNVKQAKYMMPYDVIISNCDVNMNVTSSSDRSAIFSGGQNFFINISILDSSFNGEYVDENPALLFANGNGFNVNAHFDFTKYIETWGKVTISNVTLNGYIFALSGGNINFSTNQKYEFDGLINSSNYKLLDEDSTMKIKYDNSNSVYTFTPTNKDTDSYQIGLYLGKLDWISHTGTNVGETSNYRLNIIVRKEELTNFSIKKSIPLSLRQAREKGMQIDESLFKNSLNGEKYQFITHNGVEYIIVNFDESLNKFDFTGEKFNNVTLTALCGGKPVAYVKA